jgi:hypothetical protein
MVDKYPDAMFGNIGDLGHQSGCTRHRRSPFGGTGQGALKSLAGASFFARPRPLPAAGAEGSL